MKVIIGLGNPGKEYEKTRHNAGFFVLDAIASHYQVQFQKSKFNADIATTQVKQEKVLLVKPQTYMNLSGEAVSKIVNFYKLSKEDLIVVYDDLDLTLGNIRLRQKGSAGGQNGMKNIIQLLNTQEIYRIRVGIGKNAMIPTVDWVLGKFSEEEFPIFLKAVELSKQAVIESLETSFSKAMNTYNKK